MRKRVTAALPLLALAGLLTAGCGSSATVGAQAPAPVASLAARQAPPKDPAAARAAAFRKWGVPLLAPPPPPPAVKPVRTGGGRVPVVSRIPTTRKIVFVTFDDGAEKDPRFVQMMQDLRIPFTMFLTDDLIKNDYAFFKPLQALGDPIEDHTLTHPDLPTESPARQRREICAQQTRLAHEYGVRPGLFRPPYGDYDAATRAAVGSCGGLRAIILWRETMEIKYVEFQDPRRRYHPGDIILAHFRGPKELKGESMTAMTRNLLRSIAAQGFTVAPLEDYV